MPEYIPPCHFGPCPDKGLVEGSGQRLCESIARCMIEAGGAGILEVDFCPTRAMFTLGPEQDDPHMAEVREKLGITGYFEDGDDLFD